MYNSYYFQMADIESNLNKLDNPQIVKNIYLFNKSLNSLNSRGNLKLKIFSQYKVYKIFLRRIVESASIITKTTNKNILKYFRTITLQFTINDKLFPKIFKNLPLTFNLLLYTFILLPTRTL
jgi:hypothetical protein